MKLDGATVSAVRQLIQQAQAAHRAVGQTKQSLVGSVKQRDRLWAKLSLGERYLGGYLGGNRGKATVYRAAQTQVTTGQAWVNTLTIEATALDERVIQALRAALLEFELYRILGHTIGQATAALAAVYDFSQVVRNTVDHIRRNQWLDTLNTISNSPGVMATDYCATGEGEKAIRLAGHAAVGFRSAVSHYNLLVSDRFKASSSDHALITVGSVFDLSRCDTGFDGDFDFNFGFLNFLHTPEPKNAKASQIRTDLLQAKRQVERIRSMIARHREALIEQQTVFLEDAHRQCIQG